MDAKPDNFRNQKMGKVCASIHCQILEEDQLPVAIIAMPNENTRYETKQI